MTFWTDVNGKGVQDQNAADPEVLTYRWRPDTQTLTLTANDASGTATPQPVLAAAVSNFTLELRSSACQHDANGHGNTTWLEVDYAVGHNNGVADSTELPLLVLVSVSITAPDHTHEPAYQNPVALRTRPADSARHPYMKLPD